MISELVVAGLFGSFMAGSLVGRLFVGEKPPKSPSEPTCTGYRAFVRKPDGKWSTEYFSKDDCAALRAPTCMDGRCTLHCRENCKCESPPEATPPGVPEPKLTKRAPPKRSETKP